VVTFDDKHDKFLKNLLYSRLRRIPRRLTTEESIKD